MAGPRWRHQDVRQHLGRGEHGLPVAGVEPVKGQGAPGQRGAAMARCQGVGPVRRSRPWRCAWRRGPGQRGRPSASAARVRPRRAARACCRQWVSRWPRCRPGCRQLRTGSPAKRRGKGGQGGAVWPPARRMRRSALRLHRWTANRSADPAVTAAAEVSAMGAGEGNGATRSMRCSSATRVRSSHLLRGIACSCLVIQMPHVRATGHQLGLGVGERVRASRASNGWWVASRR